MKIQVGGVSFSCAHFIEIQGAFERLHGHNFTVSAEATVPGRTDMVMDFRELRAILEEVASFLDHRLLVPTRNPGLSVSKSESHWDIVAGGKRYRMPRADVVALPIGNSTAEEIGHYIFKEASGMLPSGVSLVTVTLEEAEGRRAIIKSR